MNYNYFFVGLLLICICCLPASAANETSRVEKVSMYLYGDASYVNGVPVPAGTLITAKDQFGSIIGEYIIKKLGKYGEEYSNDKFEIGVWRNQSDKMNRTMPIRILFTIGGSPAKNILDFKQNDEIKYDIISQSMENIQISPTPVKTTAPGKTPQPTSAPSGVRTLPTAPISASAQATPLPTQAQPSQTQTTSQPATLQPQTAQTPTPQAQPTQLPENPDETKQLIYYGIIGAVIIILAILIIGVIYSYLMSKTSRDEVMQVDGKWKK